MAKHSRLECRSRLTKTQVGIAATICHVRRASIEAMKALAALTDGSLPNQDRALQAGAPALLCRVAQAAVQSGSTADAETACKPCYSRSFLFPILTLSVLLLRCLTEQFVWTQNKIFGCKLC